ncbi:mitochondrial glutamate carrier 2-like [Ostrea edulis]|uniref:mitochondrial glutamate carrier 2-like n=1 Tax=Ostrea edulis TaxID=37623 RepID=UPI0020958E12|nr:mitochondrial glutamate carrier 2-like [Ostrea edulis]
MKQTEKSVDVSVTPPTPRFFPLPKVINGAIAGIVGVTCVFPIDLVKTRLQNQQPMPNGELYYKSLYDCAKKTFKNERFLGMYRGSAVNLLLITPEKALKLVVNDYLRYKFTNKNGVLSSGGAIVSGAGAGLCQIIVTTPMELLKIQQQDAGRSGAAKSERITATGTALKLIREKGILGIYKGFRATALRDVTFSAIYFPLFAIFNEKLISADVTGLAKGLDQPVFIYSLCAGIAAGGIASLSVNPFDVVKTRLQTLKKAEGEISYSGIVDCFTKVYGKEGWRAFFKGGFCRILVIAPLFGIAQGVYFLGIGESIVDFFSKSK